MNDEKEELPFYSWKPFYQSPCLPIGFLLISSLYATTGATAKTTGEFICENIQALNVTDNGEVLDDDLATEPAAKLDAQLLELRELVPCHRARIIRDRAKRRLGPFAAKALLCQPKLVGLAIQSRLEAR